MKSPATGEISTIAFVVVAIVGTKTDEAAVIIPDEATVKVPAVYVPEETPELVRVMVVVVLPPDTALVVVTLPVAMTL